MLHGQADNPQASRFINPVTCSCLQIRQLKVADRGPLADLSSDVWLSETFPKVSEREGALRKPKHGRPGPSCVHMPASCIFSWSSFCELDGLCHGLRAQYLAEVNYPHQFSPATQLATLEWLAALAMHLDYSDDGEPPTPYSLHAWRKPPRFEHRRGGPLAHARATPASQQCAAGPGMLA